ncbi:hypothetical protein F5Y16DRAFT_42009 [Xylariaceae sp. FL0255]|nr:hypothetical protein F5Y16DRAFT_42009 [Xylariaceae sp. FL0255]
MDKWNAEIAPLIYQDLEGKLPLRLLLIHEGEPGSPLRTSLIPTTLQEAENTYIATSYTRGSPENPELIQCGDSKLWVQRNAFHMMLDLRRSDETRKVWIDAICINQCSLDKRAAQVAIMNHIYQKAASVSIWLGQPDDHSSAAMTFAATLDTKKLIGEFHSCGMGNNWLKFAEKSYLLDDPMYTSLTTEEATSLSIAIVEFLNRAWFTRVWIQQEGSSCRDTQVVCGPKVVHWDNIFSLAWLMCPRRTESWPSHIHERLDQTINNAQAVRIIQRVRHYYFPELYGHSDVSPSFENLVENVSRYEVTDARDRIYAMGSMVEDGSNWFEVDYRIPWQVLYADIASRFIDVGAFGFLRCAGRVRQAPGTILPSWAPDYSYRDESQVMARHVLWRAGGSGQPAYALMRGKKRSRITQLPKKKQRRIDMPEELRAYKDPRKSLLQSYASLKCLMSDEIVYAGGLVDAECNNLETNVKRIVDFINKDMEYISTMNACPYFNGNSLIDAYRLTLILGYDQNEEMIEPDYVQEHWDDWYGWYQKGCLGYWEESIKKPMLNASYENSGVMKTFRFAITRNGYFCLVPHIVEVGDEVALFQFYELAVALRRQQGNNSGNEHADKNLPAAKSDPLFFELLGDAYIHGMMGNEANCITDEFKCKYEGTPAHWEKICKASDGGRGKSWQTLGLHGGYERILRTLGPRMVNLI